MPVVAKSILFGAMVAVAVGGVPLIGRIAPYCAPHPLRTGFGLGVLLAAIAATAAIAVLGAVGRLLDGAGRLTGGWRIVRLLWSNDSTAMSVLQWTLTAIVLAVGLYTLRDWWFMSCLPTDEFGVHYWNLRRQFHFLGVWVWAGACAFLLDGLSTGRGIPVLGKTSGE